jgi:multicomponent Na+:H+ antiporter subunit D
MTSALFVIPFAGAMAAWAAPRRIAPWLGFTTALGTWVAVIQLVRKVWSEETIRYSLGGWLSPLGIQLYADGLAAMLLLLTAIVALFITLYAQAYLSLDQENRNLRRLFWPVWLLLWGALNALFLSADAFNLYVLLELVTLAGVTLAALARSSESSLAALRYLLASMTGSMAYLLGVGILYGQHGVLDLHLLGAVVRPGEGSSVAFALMVVGLLLKTALFPLHFWLPGAHSSALAPVSAALSGLVVKASFYMLLRLWFEVFQGMELRAAAHCLGVLGACAILWGSFQALRQTKIKLLVAHSTVGQLGYLFLLFPLATLSPGTGQATWLVEAWSGGIYQVVSHGLAKASLFLAAGVILHAAGSDDLQSLRDIAGRLPVTTFTLGLAGMSLMGLPPSGGFVAKWMFLKAIFESGQWWWAPVLLLGGLLTAGYVFMMLRYPFIPMEKRLLLRPVPQVMEWTGLALALASVLIGFRMEEPVTLLLRGTRIQGLEGVE